MPVFKAAKCWQTSHFRKKNKLWGDISFGLPRPLCTAFELKIDLQTSKNQPDATAPTEYAINSLKRPKNIKIFSLNLPNFQTKYQKWQIWELIVYPNVPARRRPVCSSFSLEADLAWQNLDAGIGASEVWDRSLHVREVLMTLYTD